jgi:hypothetical protein
MGAPARPHRVRWIARGARALAPVWVLALGGCSVLSPIPAWEAMKAAGQMAGLAMAQGGAHASQTVHHGEPAPSRVCIELNPYTPMAELVPTLQGELRRHAIDSRVYAAGEGDPACGHWLRYSAQIDWGTPPWSQDTRAYLRRLQLVLVHGDGRVMSTSQYDGDSGPTGRWAATQQKLQPVVRALVTGFES